MIRKVKREWSKKEKAFHAVDAWGDKKLPEINSAINRLYNRSSGNFRKDDVIHVKH